MGLKKKDEPSLTFLNFQGEFISIMLETKVMASTMTEEGELTSEIPLSVQAYLTDEDENYFYLGSVPNSIDKAISKNKIIYIEILRTKDPYTDILEGMEEPSSGSEFN